MAVIGFALARNALSPGWAPAAATAHDALWTDAATGYDWQPAGGGAGGSSTGQGLQFDSGQGSIGITAAHFATSGTMAAAGAATALVSLDWSADGQHATLALNGAWNSIKDAEIRDFTGASLTLVNWVDAWVHLANDFGQSIRLDGSKRGEVTTGSGNDTVWIGVDSNNAGWTNHFRIDTGDGDDTVEITVATRDYSITSFKGAYDPRWTTTEILTGRGNDTVNGGDGADRVWLGEGDDVFQGRGGDDWADGGSGFDIAIFDGARAEFSITWISDGVMVFDLREGAPAGIDTLLHFEALHFSDASISLLAGNIAPLARADLFTLGEDGVLAVGAALGVLANDSDADGDVLTAVLVTGPAHGALALAGDGSFLYVPDADWFGTDSFTYLASDGTASSGTAMVTLVVTPVNDAPSAADDSYGLIAGQTLVIGAAGVLANDRDVEPGPLAAVLVSGPAHGILSLSADGGFTYTPDAGFTGEDGFVYAATDAEGAQDQAMVQLLVRPPNLAPLGSPDHYAIAEDGVLAVSAANGVLANDSDPEGEALAALLAGAPLHGQLSLNHDGSFIYRPDADWNGIDSFTYRPTDGVAIAPPVLVTIAVAAVNDAPTARPESYVLNEDSTLSVAPPGVLTNDFDIDGDLLSALSASAPAHGSLTWHGDGGFTYTPDPDWFGTDSFTYSITDGQIAATAAVTLVVVNTDDGVIARDDSYSGLEDVTLFVAAADGLLANDSGADGGLSVIAGTFATELGGSVVVRADGAFIYQPAANVFGTDRFTYTMRDIDGDSASASVIIEVADVGEGPPDAPIAQLVVSHGAVRFAGAMPMDQAGSALSGGKDVNGDGIPDIVIGAPGLDAAGRMDAGGAYVVFGSGALADEIALGSLGSGGFRIIGARAGDRAGISVALIDDMNGDGRAEIAIGASGYDASGMTNAGGVFVVFGRAGTTEVDLAQIALGNGGFLIRGAGLQDGLGSAVASAGDVNGDGRGDIVLGASLANAPGYDSGAAYVVFGKATGGMVNVAAMGAQGFVINGAGINDQLGFAVAGVGDVNGDGRADIAIGARLSDLGGTDSGAVFVVFGKTSATPVNLGNLGSGGFRITGADSGDLAGFSLGPAGDLNGDGLADLFIGAPGAGQGSFDTGGAYVVYGKAGTAAVSLAQLGGGGFAMAGEAQADLAGRAVAVAGDVNGDGLMDFLIGAPGSDEAGIDAGGVYVILGRAGGLVDLQLSDLTEGGLRLTGTQPGDALGQAVAAVGDVNGDGLMDFLIGAPLADTPANASGAAWLVYGQHDWVF